MIRVDRLTKKYKKKTAVHELSFEAKNGTVFALLGANGAGKSTTLKCILGIAGTY
ncbi:MAG: ATP-binding cassette domain-containing protein [Lachnospiraceae bacterium]|nr:ATP-binding cassette domain-containing protein [Lachnospiraceae bacterium]